MKKAWSCLAVFMLVLAVPVAAGVKEDQHAQLIDLAQQMRTMKSQGQAGSSAYSSLRSQYQTLSAAMGGDDPGSSSPDGQPAVDGRSPNAPQGGGVVPPAPAGCIVTTGTTTQSTPTAVPTGPAVVTSTVIVAGAGPYLWDLNLVTNLTHTFAADLDITLASPAGTVVTLTTDNGGSNDNVYNGTTWDDDANPAGQVPYTTNSGLVTDHAYVNLTTATPLVPEEAFGAFIGEDPNGTWTITISDDLAGDGGSLDSWSLEVSTLPAPPAVLNTAASQNTPVAIPTGPAVVSSTLVVAGAGASLVDIDLTTNLTHTFAADLDITLMSPAGTVVTLTTDNGGSNDNVHNGTTWDDDANPAGQVPYTTNSGLATDHAYVNLTTATPLVPEEAMAAFIGEDPNGTWTITISDDLAGDGGSLDSWSLDIDTGTCALPCELTCPANITQSNDPNQCGAVVNYPPPGTTGTCGTITCSPPSGSFFPVGTTTITCSEQIPALGAATCDFTATVIDTQPPVITCPANIEEDLPAGEFEGTASWADPTVSDNCPGVGAPNCVPPSGSTFQGDVLTPVVCDTADGAGNTASCTFTVLLGLVSILEVPTASTWGLAALALLLAGAAFLVMRRNG